MYTFPELLKKIRETSGLTQEQMGKALDVSTVLITMIETGQKDASRKFIVKLADRLDVHPTSITPFMFNDDDGSRNGSKIEVALNNIGERLQIFLIADRAKKLKKYA